MKWTTIRDRILTGLGIATAALIVSSSFSGSPTTTDGAEAPSHQVATAAGTTAYSEGERID